jgi:protein involved in polysaccharide export with SLBB domain
MKSSTTPMAVDLMRSTPFTSRLVRLAVLLLSIEGAGLLLGCSSLSGLSGSSTSAKPKLAGAGEEVAGRLRPGDQLQVRLDIGSQQNQAPQTHDVSIDENGEILLPLVGPIKAADLTQSELAERIQANYVPRYYVRCTVTVLAALRFFYMSGEVRNPTRYPWSDGMTLLNAISTASGFTDYANRRKVELSRGKERSVYDCEDLRRNPGKDPLIRPGDTITVPRSIF